MVNVREQVGLQKVDVAYEAVAPAGMPAVENVTVWVDPELRLAVMVLVTDCPAATDLLPPLMRAKLKVDVTGTVLQSSPV
jgi:hypothetical protein